MLNELETCRWETHVSWLALGVLLWVLPVLEKVSRGFPFEHAVEKKRHLLTLEAVTSTALPKACDNGGWACGRISGGVCGGGTCCRVLLFSLVMDPRGTRKDTKDTGDSTEGNRGKRRLHGRRRRRLGHHRRCWRLGRGLQRAGPCGCGCHLRRPGLQCERGVFKVKTSARHNKSATSSTDHVLLVPQHGRAGFGWLVSLSCTGRVIEELGSKSIGWAVLPWVFTTRWRVCGRGNRQ